MLESYYPVHQQLSTMNFLPFYFTIIFLTVFTSAQAHDGSLQGTITDNISNFPITGLIVSMEEEHLSTVTDSNGYYQFDNIPVKLYTITFRKEDYLTREMKISISENKSTVLDIALTPGIISLPDLVVNGDVPVSAASSQVFSIIDFQLRPKNSAQDMLRLVPGLFIAQHAGG
ncbi:MAG: carboxypeptidase-like regulatory domain-containing protein, partial [Chitinophagales bacterium]